MSNKCCPNKKKCRGGTLFSKMMSQRTQNKHTQHIPVTIWSLTVFIFVNFPAKPSLLKRLSLNHTQFLRKGSHSTYDSETTDPLRRCSLPRRHHQLRESCDHQYDAPLMFQGKKSLLSPNNAFFIGTASVVKRAADTPDCQRLGEQWHYLFFYVRPHDAAYNNADLIHWRIYAALGGDELTYQASQPSRNIWQRHTNHVLISKASSCRSRRK